MKRVVPLVDLAWQQAVVAAEVRAGWDAVLARNAFVLGEEVAAFEQEFAAFCGVARSVGVANGTDALELALRAMGIGHGDEVIVPANSFVPRYNTMSLFRVPADHHVTLVAPWAQDDRLSITGWFLT